MKILLVLAVIFSSLAFWGQRLFLVLGLEPAGIALPVGKAISLLLGAGCLSFAWRMELRELRRSFFPQAPQKELLILMIATALVLFFALFAAGELLDQLVTGPVR
ncbi:hypothetical protein [Candidatus Methylacidithermus pantelleriae]|nr:hypothetical protein [Candidatus Methylacidithermus pantelleriae]